MDREKYVVDGEEYAAVSGTQAKIAHRVCSKQKAQKHTLVYVIAPSCVIHGPYQYDSYEDAVKAFYEILRPVFLDTALGFGDAKSANDMMSDIETLFSTLNYKYGYNYASYKISPLSSQVGF